MVTAPLVCRAASVPRSALRCERPLESDLVGQRPIPETCVDRAHRPIRLVVSGLEALRSEEHTSELQSPDHLVCRLLLEKKKKHKRTHALDKKKKKNNTHI